MLVLAAALGRAGDCIGSYTRISDSVRGFQRNFAALDRAEAPLNPVDRFFLSLILSDNDRKQKGTCGI